MIKCLVRLYKENRFCNLGFDEAFSLLSVLGLSKAIETVHNANLMS